MFVISNDKHSQECKDLTILKNILLEQYLGTNVCIQYKDKCGDCYLDLVTIETTGHIRYSYGTQHPYDFSKLENARYVW